MAAFEDFAIAFKQNELEDAPEAGARLCLCCENRSTKIGSSEAWTTCAGGLRLQFSKPPAQRRALHERAAMSLGYTCTIAIGCDSTK